MTISTSMKVSIITVCRNSEKTIRRTIESVRSQTYSNIEYIIVDGNSTDGTNAIIREYQADLGSKLRYISESDQGIYDAMNKGIRLATGELIGIINSDDFYESSAVTDIVANMTNEKYQILYGFVRGWKDEQEYDIRRQSHFFLKDSMICHPGCFVTKAVYDAFGCFNTMYKSVADYDFMLRMSELKEVHFYPVNSVIANYTFGGMSASNEAWLDLLKLRRENGIISLTKYRYEVCKNKLFILLQSPFNKK